MPTSCDNATSTTEISNYTNAELSTGNSTFTPTGCASVPFAPNMSLEFGKAGENALNGFPPVTVRITNPENNADVRANVIALPEVLNSNNTAYKTCSQAEADANTCPANSQFGTATARSPFIANPLSGPVYLVQQTAGSLPGLLLDLQGQIRVKIQTSTVLTGSGIKRIQSVSTNVPQLPVSELTVSLNSGKNNGVFQNRSDLCFQEGSTSKFAKFGGNFFFGGWNDAIVASSYDAKVNECAPGFSGKLSSAQKSKPKLSLTATRHPDAKNIKALEVSLPKGMTLVKKRFSKATADASAKLSRTQFKRLSNRRLQVTGLPAAGVSKIKISLKSGALKLSKSKRKSLNRGKKLTFKVKATDTPVSGPNVANTASVVVQGKKK
jgi:hypothetical protein